MPAGDLPLGDRHNMAYMGTVVTYGRGAGVVVATGMHTELGNIAELLQGVETEQTPLQRRLDQVGKILAIAGVLVAILVGVIGVLRGEAILDMFLVGVSIAVAVVPEGLPAVVTITLALGARRMLARNALIRKLPAVETLGSVTVICSDKTGTLTENRMTVTVLDVAGHRIDLTEELTDAGQARFTTQQAQTAPDQAINLLLTGGALCNDAQLQRDDSSGRYHALGDPTEGALVVAAARLGLQKQELDQAMPRLAELPFDSDRKRMTTVHQPSADAAAPALARASASPSPRAPWTVSWTLPATCGTTTAAWRSTPPTARGSRRPIAAWPRMGCASWAWPSGCWTRTSRWPKPA